MINLIMESGVFGTNKYTKTNENEGDPRLKQFLKNYKSRKNI